MRAKSATRSILSGSLWGILSKILDSLAKFVTIPMLVGFYGKADYGLIALTFSLNAYLRLMDIGMNVGSIRFFSIWLAEGNFEKIGKVSRSSIVFYGGIGIVNAAIFIVMANYSGDFFQLEKSQLPLFKVMMYILAISSIFNWISNVITQLLSAKGELGWINGMNLVSSVFNFITAWVAIKFNLSLPTYFILFTISTLLPVPLNIYKLKVFNVPLSELLRPKWDGKAFSEILRYSLAIFAMGIFQLTANNLRPILLSKYSSMGVEVLTDYRVIQTIAMLVIAFGSVFMQVLLPSASKVYAENDKIKLENLVYQGTKYVSIFLSFVVFILCLNSSNLLIVYMGSGYQYLSKWLIIWLVTVLLMLHNSTIASVVLSTGKTRFLVYTSAISCIVSIPVTIILADAYNVGAAVIGYFVYVVLQIAAYYFYYIPFVLKLNSAKIFFKYFCPSLIGGIASWLITDLIGKYITTTSYYTILVYSIIFSLLFVTYTLTVLLSSGEIKMFMQKLKK